MFCPICGDEYREGFTECADCHVPLVPEPLPSAPVEPKPFLSDPAPEVEYEYVEYKYVLTIYDTVEMALIRGVLESEGIIHSFDGEGVYMYRSVTPPMRLLVKKDQVEQAIEIIADMNLQHTTFFSGNTELEEDESDETPEDPINSHYDRSGR